MEEVILVKYGEMALKGLNKRGFEKQLLQQMKRRLRPLGEFLFTCAQSTVYIEPRSRDISLGQAVSRLQKVFGIAAICRACACEKSMEDIEKKAATYLHDTLSSPVTFKVEAKRADKQFPLKSPEICSELGGYLCETFPHLQVDVHEPDVTVMVDIRDTNAYVYAERIKGAGGLPLGTSGKAMLLLSGGIDSPVAGYMMAKRGMIISAVHFVSPPYTSERARLKVERLCEKMAEYCGDIGFWCVPFTAVQEAIRDRAPEEYATILMRRMMMQVAQMLADREGACALITGESVGQVASQTPDALVCTDAVCHLPVFRPCIGMDKTEITELSRKIGTFDISIEPYEDCCAVFTPKHPKLHPQRERVEEIQAKGDYDALILEAAEGAKLKIIRAES